MQTIREYAREHGITYEAVRAQIARYRKDLEGHIITGGRTMFLDDSAVQFLDKKRMNNPVVVRQETERTDNENLKAQVDALKNELMAAQKKIIEAQDANRLLIEAKAKYELLTEANAKNQKEIETLRTDLSEARKNVEQLQTDAQTAKIDAVKALEEAKAARSEADRAKADADQARKERDTAQAEAGSYRKSIFGLYRKTRS